MRRERERGKREGAPLDLRITLCSVSLSRALFLSFSKQLFAEEREDGESGRGHAGAWPFPCFFKSKG